MENNISRRDFIKMMGVGAASISLGTYLVGCNSEEEEIMPVDKLREYHVFKLR